MESGRACCRWKPVRMTETETESILVAAHGEGWTQLLKLDNGCELLFGSLGFTERTVLPLCLDRPVSGFSAYLQGAISCSFAGQDSVRIRGGEAGTFRFPPARGKGVFEPGRVTFVEMRLSSELACRIDPGVREGAPLLCVEPMAAGVSDIVRAILTCPFNGVSRAFFLEGKSLELLALMTSRNRIEPPEIRAIRQAGDQLVREMADPPGLAELARSAGLSRTRFAEGFRTTFGLPPFAYLRERRLERAHALLFSGASNVTEAALSVGYSNPSHFARIYRKRYGVPPSVYRAECLRNG